MDRKLAGSAADYVDLGFSKECDDIDKAFFVSG